MEHVLTLTNANYTYMTALSEMCAKIHMGHMFVMNHVMMAKPGMEGHLNVKT